jgi:hypothetical protein
MPSGVYPRKPKPPDPFKLAKGHTIKKMEYADAYRISLLITLDNGDVLEFEGYEDSMMFNDRWSAVSVRYYLADDPEKPVASPY